MHYYKAYTLGLHSVVSLPQLIASETSKDVVIQWGKVADPPPEGKARGYYYWRDKQDIFLFWEALGTFQIRKGQEITISPARQVEEQQLCQPILGACMAVILHQRGFLILHASAVEMSEGAIAFLGDKGWGKSTMAAVLQARGHPLLTDDILALKLEENNQPIVLPSFSQIKLCPSAITALGGDPDSFPSIVPQSKKRQCQGTGDFSQGPVPLKKIYLLGKGAFLTVNPLRWGQVLGELFRHSYSGKFGKSLLQHGEIWHFHQCMELAKRVPIYHLQRPSALSLLPEIAQLVEEHV